MRSVHTVQFSDVKKSISQRKGQFPYFRVQSYNERQCSWVADRKEAFDTFESAQAYVQQQPPGRQLRILIIDEKESRVAHSGQDHPNKRGVAIS